MGVCRLGAVYRRGKAMNRWLLFSAPHVDGRAHRPLPQESKEKHPDGNSVSDLKNGYLAFQQRESSLISVCSGWIGRFGIAYIAAGNHNPAGTLE